MPLISNYILQSCSSQNIVDWLKNKTVRSLEQNREPRNKPTCMISKFMTEEPRMYNGERTVPLINGAGKIGPLSYTIHKN